MVNSLPTHRTLSELKAIVDRNLKSTIECGEALREIRDNKLFLEECGSFDEFCEKNWGVTRQRAYQLIDSANVVDSLPKSVSTMVDSERVARELKKVPVEAREAVLQRATVNGKATGASVARAAKEVQVEIPEVFDRTGFPIPQSSPAMATWARISEAQEMLTNLSRTKGVMERAMESRDVLYAEVNFSALIADIQSSYQLLKVAIPFAICPTCQGRVLSPCSTCNGRGMVSEFYWKHKVPEKTREIREKAVTLMVDKKKGKK